MEDGGAASFLFYRLPPARLLAFPFKVQTRSPFRHHASARGDLSNRESPEVSEGWPHRPEQQSSTSYPTPRSVAATLRAT
jgi:hypothetical protein